MASVLFFASIFFIWNLVNSVNGGAFVQPSVSSVVTVAETEAYLPCKYQPSEDETVFQVVWTKDGETDPIIAATSTDVPRESNAYAGRVRFESTNFLENSALIILNTRQSDQGSYTCTLTTFPMGNVKTYATLTVWSTPISTLDPVILVEGQSFRTVATCRAVATPPAGLSWDTDLPGQSQNRSLEGGVVSIQFALHPLRNMNGRKLDCLVWHPSLKSPRRLSNQLVVHYPPDAAISGYDENWYVGLEGASLKCDVGGNPKPENFTWSRKDNGLPDGVIVEKEILRFGRPLCSTDSGVYECLATNPVGSGNANLEITVATNPTPFDKLLLIIIGAVAAVMVLILVIVVITVNQHHKRKTKQLAIELHQKKEEINTLSRQASIRIYGSKSIDKYQMDENVPLRDDEATQNSFSSLERPRSRESHSTLGGRDSLGRPSIYNTSRRGHERMFDREKDRIPSQLKVESNNAKNSNMSLVHSESYFHPPLYPAHFPLENTAEIIRSRNGSAILPADGRPPSGSSSQAGSRGGSRAGSRGLQSPLNSAYPVLTDEEEGDLALADEDSELPTILTETDNLENGGSETASSQIFEAMSNHFEHTNGKLCPKSKPNNIILPPVHTSTIHHSHLV